MFIDELKDYIVAQSGFVEGTSLFIGSLPDTLTGVVAIQESNTNNLYNIGNELGYSIKDIVFRVRGTESEYVTRLLASTLDFLENLTDTNLTNYRIVRGEFSTPPYQLDGVDKNNNYIYVGVYSATLERI